MMTSVTCIFKSMLKIWRGFRREPENVLKTRDNVPQLKEINLFSLYKRKPRSWLNCISSLTVRKQQVLKCSLIWWRTI